MRRQVLVYRRVRASCARCSTSSSEAPLHAIPSSAKHVVLSSSSSVRHTTEDVHSMRGVMMTLTGHIPSPICSSETQSPINRDEKRQQVPSLRHLMG